MFNSVLKSSIYRVDANGKISEFNPLDLKSREKFRNTYKIDSTVKNIESKYKYKTLIDAINASTAIKAKAEEAKPSAPRLNFVEATSLIGAIGAYQAAVDGVARLGVENLNESDRKIISQLARQVRDYDSKDLSANVKQVITNIGDSERALNAIYDQIETVNVQAARTRSGSDKAREAARGRLFTEQDTLRRLISTARNDIPLLSESLGRVEFSDISGVQPLGARAGAPSATATLAGAAPALGAGVGAVGAAPTVQAGLQALSSGAVFGTGDLAGQLNSQVTDEQILGDINNARRNQYKSLYDVGTAAITDLQSRLTAANSFLADLPQGDRRRATTQASIDSLKTELATAQSDTLKAKDLYENYQPISGADATSAVSKFRQSLRLPEQRTLDQIKEIDPNLFNTIQGMSQQYREMAQAPLPETTAPSTEALRKATEESIANQLRLGSTIGQEERRGYEQAIRAAQTARGNIAGLGPAVQEAAQIGAMGEQRLAARLGAAQGFLASGQSMSDALARDVSLRNALQQSRLGAAAQFAAAGPSPYTLASQRAAQQQALLQQYAGGATQQAAALAGGFQAQPTAMTPYAYVNPQAGFIGAQTGAQIYGDLAKYQADTYGAYSRAVASQPSFGQTFGNIASGLGNLFSFSKAF